MSLFTAISRFFQAIGRLLTGKLNNGTRAINGQSPETAKAALADQQQDLATNAAKVLRDKALAIQERDRRKTALAGLKQTYADYAAAAKKAMEAGNEATAEKFINECEAMSTKIARAETSLSQQEAVVQEFERASAAVMKSTTEFGAKAADAVDALQQAQARRTAQESLATAQAALTGAGANESALNDVLSMAAEADASAQVQQALTETVTPGAALARDTEAQKLLDEVRGAQKGNLADRLAKL